MRKPVLIVLVALALIAATSGYVFFRQSPRAGASDIKSSQDLQVGYAELRISLPVFVAIEKGYFRDEGLNVTAIPFDTAQPMIQALAAGKFPVAGYCAFPIIFDAMRRTNKPLMFVTLLNEDQQHRISYFLKRNGPEGAAIRSLADLKGKRIGILPTRAYEVWLKLILKDVGIDPSKDVVIQPVAPDQEVAALASGGVDALFTNDPVATAAIRKGVGLQIDNYVEIPKYFVDPFPFATFVMDGEWVNGHHKEAAEVAVALTRAISYVDAHPDDSARIMAKFLPPQFAGDAALYPRSRFVSPANVNSDQLQRLEEFYKKNGLMPSDLSLVDSMYR